jgi:(1->4)-alpha-D-glucan 1-alpha-D-glucosylmutase
MSGGPRPAPRATYRLQLNKEFGFADAEPLAPYLARLGTSHAYLSPILKARAGSMHGYDTVDHAEINPELGGIAGFRRMAGAFRAAGIGIVLDIVPNHMGIGGSDNPYWLDMLESGEASRFARWFDIDWAPAEPSLGGKVLAPFLDRPLGEALGSDVLELRHDAADDSYALWVHGHHKLPLARETYAEAAAVLAGGGSLAGLLDRQHWRLADARTADDEINYRRFFIISDLAGIRVEDEAVFEPVHRLVFALVAEGLVDGLRVDHIDGLHDPAAYCRKLRARAPRPVFIVVEKILGEDE